MGLRGKLEETSLSVESSSSYSSCLASAVTLSSGDVILTGGQGQAREVFLVSGAELEAWKRLSRMSSPRYGHASCCLVVEGEEKVMVAGGWDLKGRVQATVELYSLSKDKWYQLEDMLSPRVYFSLQVGPKT